MSKASRGRRRAALVLWLLPVILAGRAGAQAAMPTAPLAPSTSAAIEQAKLLIVEGRLAEAKLSLTALARVVPNDAEVAFLLGVVAVQLHDYPAAIHQFRRVLARQPNAIRVRLELARAFFLAKDYDNAERQFRLSRSARLPAQVAANIDSYLTQIRQRRQWSYYLSVGVAGDTNINAGPALTSITLFGAPFQLSPETQKRSGDGLAIDGSTEWSPSLGPTWKFRLGGQIRSLDYGARAFDDTTVATYSGVEWASGRWSVSPVLTGFERQYGGVLYNEGAGGSLQVLFYPTTRLSLRAVVGAQLVTYRQISSQDGPVWSDSWTAVYTLDPGTVISATVAHSAQDAEIKAFSDTTVKLGFGYFRELPAGFSLSFQPSYARLTYAGRLAIFAVPRADTQWVAEVSLLNRRIDLDGFTPRITYSFTRNASNLPIYTYDRNRIEFGLTRAF